MTNCSLIHSSSWSKPWSCTDSCSTDLWTDGSSRMNASFHFSSFSRLEETKERKEKEMKTKACDSKDILCIHCLFLSFLINGNRSLSKNAFSSRNSSRFTICWMDGRCSAHRSMNRFPDDETTIGSHRPLGRNCRRTLLTQLTDRF